MENVILIKQYLISFNLKIAYFKNFQHTTVDTENGLLRRINDDNFTPNIEESNNQQKARDENMEQGEL